MSDEFDSVFDVVPPEKRAEFAHGVVELAKRYASGGGSDIAGETNRKAQAILAEAGIDFDPDDPAFEAHVKPHVNAQDPQVYLEGVTEYAKKSRKSLAKSYQKEMDALLDRGAGSIEKRICRDKYRKLGLNI